MRLHRVLFGLWLSLAAASAAEPAAPPVQKLSLDDCIKLALEHNLSVQIQRLNPEMARFAVAIAYAGYDPNFSVNGTHYFSTSPGSIDRVTKLQSPSGTVDANNFNTSLGGLTPIGLNYSLSGNIGESYGVAGGFPFDSSSGGASISMSQPLLKNFWIDSVRQNILVSKKNLKESELNLRNQVMTIVESVEEAYFGVIAAKLNVEAMEIALQLANRSLAENKKRVEVGAMAPLDEKQAESQVAASRANLVGAQQTMALQQNTLKGLLVENFSSWQQNLIEATESLSAVPQVFSLQDSWHKGLTMRPDLLQARTEVEKQDIVLRYTFNQLFPELDLVGSYGHSGGNAIMRDYGGVLGQIEQGKNPSYSYGAQLVVPLSNRAARYNYKTSKAQKRQLVLQLKQLEQSVMIQIDNAIKQAQTSFERVDSTKQARLYADEALKAEQKKLEQGKSTSFVVLQLQSTLTGTRQAEIQALSDYNVALARLALAEGYTLERNHLNLTLK
jgi:outer membrane protein